VRVTSNCNVLHFEVTSPALPLAVVPTVRAVLEWLPAWAWVQILRIKIISANVLRLKSYFLRQTRNFDFNFDGVLSQ